MSFLERSPTMPRRAQKQSKSIPRLKTRSKSKPAAKATKARSLRRAAPAKTAKRPAARRRMAASTGPKAAHSVRPGFTANDAHASIKWYCDVLGFSPKERWEQDGVFQG